MIKLLIAGGALVLFLFLAVNLSPISINSQSGGQADDLKCCNSGNGDACKPSTAADKTFDYQGEKYGLLKSNVKFSETYTHLSDVGHNDKGDIVISTTQAEGACGHFDADQVWGRNGECVPIPNDIIIYIRKTDGTFDVYYRLKDANNVPDIIKNCPLVSPTPGSSQGNQTVIFNDPQPGPLQKLQLKTFTVISPSPTPPATTSWLSPWCKPAIYLYPQEKTDVNVKIAPKGPLTLTIPKYLSSGWNVTAYPDGKITDQTQSFDYLYYETQIPDTLLSSQNSGYVVSYTNIEQKLRTLLPQLGLLTKESDQFIDYWLKALPKSPYYLIDVVPQKTLDEIAPLSISPKPDTIIRVTLSFAPLTSPISPTPPTLSQMPKRTGFTVVEWGGLFKKDKNHNFTCLM